MTMNIEVIYPDEKIVTKGDSVSIHRIFMQNEFTLLVEIGDKKTKFDINLPEWLLALSKFLNDDAKSTNEILTLSGSPFQAEKYRDGCRLSVYDLISKKNQWLDLNQEELTMFHARLVCELIAAVKEAAGRPLKISELASLEIKGNAGVAKAKGSD